jgi:hypothetical protein
LFTRAPAPPLRPPQLNFEDNTRTAGAISLVEAHVDFNRIIEVSKGIQGV